MATVVDALLVTLGVDSSGVDRGMNQAQERINSGVKNIVSALSAPIIAALAGFSAGAAVSAYTSTATSLDRLSQSLGMSMESLQGWQYAAESAGAEAEEVGNFFRDMNDYIVDATTFDSGPLKDIAKELGISLKDAQGNIKATEDVTLELADAFQKVSNQKAVAFGMQMSIDPGMIALLQKGRGEIEALIKAQKELGVYTKEDAEIASKARFAFMTLGRSIEAATMPIARVVVPAITWLAERFTAVAKLIRENSQFVQISLGAVSVFMLARFVPALEKMIQTHKKAILAFAPWALVLGGIAILIDDLVAYIKGGDSALAGFWAQFGTGEEILSFFQSTWEAVLAGLEKMKPLIPALLKVGAVFSVFAVGVGTMHVLTEAVLGVGSAFKALRTVLATNPLSAVILAAAAIIVYWDEIMAATQRVGNAISSAFSKAGQYIKGVWEGVFNWFKEKFQWIMDAWDGLSDLPGKIGDAVTDTASGAWESVKSFFGAGDKDAAAEAIPGAAYNSSINTRTANVTKTTTINGGINITGASDPQASGKAVSEAIRDNDDDLSFAIDTGVRQ